MTSNRVKAAARRLQATEGIPFAEALRRVLTDNPASAPSIARPPAPRLDPGPGHRCVGPMYAGELGGDREKFCPRCATPDLRNRVAAVDQAARQLRIVPPAPGADFVWHSLAWPYGPNIDLDSREALVAWAGPLDLRATSTSRRCLHWLRGQQCPRNSSYGACGATVPGADHVSAWNRGPGRSPAVVVSQPYVLHDVDRLKLAQLDSDPNLVVEINDRGGWYGAGTTWVAIWNAERHPDVAV